MVVVCLILIWLKPLRALVASLALPALLGAPQQAEAYFNQTDYTENDFILPNMSALFIPDGGDNESSQASFGSEQHLIEH